MNIAFEPLLLMLALASPAATTPAPDAGAPRALSYAPGGLYAWVEPETGRLRATPPAGESPLWVPDSIERAMSMSSDGLVERALPSGGVALDLEGRFHHALFAGVGSDGRIRYGHEAETIPAEPETQTRTDGAEEKP